MANYFFETGKFSASEPDLLADDLTNNPNYPDQWGLNNTGQNNGTVGIDINAPEAWNITLGQQNVVVAVIDHGIELNHPDLLNISPLSFDTESNSSPSLVLGNHGTACAGIIGASDNLIGSIGVAPNCTLMSISNELLLNINVRQELANGINFAWQNGASIISNSWSHVGLQGAFIDDAITAALTQGRNGLGCIVVFSSGNNNGNVGYPANSNPDILAVGAMSQCGERKSPTSCDTEDEWGSNFGTELDIVAPGVLIPTTDRQGNNGYNPNEPLHTNAGGNLVATDYIDRDYTRWFNGTSSACPHVAGVAALVLSVNPSLTGLEVRNIIERTAQKVGGYNYSTTGGRPNGTWDDEMGYGLVDANAAVQMAININGPDLVCSFPNSTFSMSNVDLSVTWQVSSNLQILSSTTNSVTVKPKYSSGSTGWVRANFSTGYSITRNVQVNNPTLTNNDVFVRDSYYNNLSGSGTYSDPYLICNGGEEHVINMDSNNVNSINYTTIPSGWTSYSYGVYEIAFTPNNMNYGNTYAIDVDYAGACGNSVHTMYFKKDDYCFSGYFKVVPNSITSTELTILKKGNNETKAFNANYEVEFLLFNDMGVQLKSKKGLTNKKNYSLNIPNLKNGIYYL
ncbi:S8 family serine peptidase [Gelatiniphilus marinus]|uniref:S8 family serine peptidase n=1 Tax=Gelatiniphilus marinus TaxID=1759464 RepID=A0ABW5JTE0_9FLAO